ncbi:MAG TPA: hypothetical protein V6C85_24855 [Allocoleopsis sp.]
MPSPKAHRQLARGRSRDEKPGCWRFYDESELYWRSLGVPIFVFAFGSCAFPEN